CVVDVSTICREASFSTSRMRPFALVRQTMKITFGWALLAKVFVRRTLVGTKSTAGSPEDVLSTWNVGALAVARAASRPFGPLSGHTVTGSPSERFRSSAAYHANGVGIRRAPSVDFAFTDPFTADTPLLTEKGSVKAKSTLGALLIPTPFAWYA